MKMKRERKIRNEIYVVTDATERKNLQKTAMSNYTTKNGQHIKNGQIHRNIQFTKTIL